MFHPKLDVTAPLPFRQFPQNVYLQIPTFLTQRSSKLPFPLIDDPGLDMLPPQHKLRAAVAPEEKSKKEFLQIPTQFSNPVAPHGEKNGYPRNTPGINRRC